MNQPKAKHRASKYEYACTTNVGKSMAVNIFDKEKILKHKMSVQVILLPYNLKLWSFGIPSPLLFEVLMLVQK